MIMKCSTTKLLVTDLNPFPRLVRTFPKTPQSLFKIDEASKEYGLLHSQCIIKTFLSYIFLKASFFCSFVSEQAYEKKKCIFDHVKYFLED